MILTPHTPIYQQSFSPEWQCSRDETEQHIQQSQKAPAEQIYFLNQLNYVIIIIITHTTVIINWNIPLCRKVVDGGCDCQLASHIASLPNIIQTYRTSYVSLCLSIHSSMSKVYQIASQLAFVGEKQCEILFSGILLAIYYGLSTDIIYCNINYIF